MCRGSRRGSDRQPGTGTVVPRCVAVDSRASAAYQSDRRPATRPQRESTIDSFAVIVPTLNEETTLEATLQHLRTFPEVTEIIVADGGSEDATTTRARRAGARVLDAPRGRGPQLHAGARAARADHLLFLHADCRLPVDAFAAIRQTFAHGSRAGLFAIDYASRHPVLVTLSWLSRLPSRWTEFGEGALFLQRDVYEAVGGFPAWPLMEDVEILRRLRRRGVLGRAPGAVRASPRRFHNGGVTRQLLRNVTVYTLFHCGVAPERLLHLYGGRPEQITRSAGGSAATRR